jgi:dynein heavy chain
MLEAQDEPGVINAATAEGRLDKLKMFEAEIGACNKALNEQLESKRKLFPRFYFVSVDILLTILSNGQNPELVNAYMGDCFDGMEFVMFDESGERPWKVVQGMKAKDGEVVDWNSKLVLEPPVEAYMNDIERGMQKTLV